MFVNAEYERLTGYSKRDVVGHNCRILQGEDTEHHIILEMSAKLRAAEDLDVNVTNYTKSGERMLIRFVARAVNDSMGMYRYSVGAQLPIDDGGDPVGMERLDMLMKMVPKQLLVPSTPQVQQRAAATKALVNGGQLKKPVATVPQTGVNGGNGRRKSTSSTIRSDVGKTDMAALVNFTKLVWLAEPVGSLTQLIGNEQFGGEFKSFLEREYMDSASWKDHRPARHDRGAAEEGGHRHPQPLHQRGWHEEQEGLGQGGPQGGRDEGRGDPSGTRGRLVPPLRGV